MRALFLFLLALILAVAAWQMGALGELPAPGREPGRIARQIAPDTIRLLDADQLAALGKPVPATTGPVPCLVFGDFEGAELARVQEPLAAIVPAAQMETQKVEGAGWFMVYLPPARSRAEAERRLEDLRAQGVRDVALIGEGALRNGLVLGSFRDLASARGHAAALEKRGVTGLRVPERPASPTTATRFVLRDIEPAQKAQLRQLATDFPGHRLAACPAP